MIGMVDGIWHILQGNSIEDFLSSIIKTRNCQQLLVDLVAMRLTSSAIFWFLSAILARLIWVWVNPPRRAIGPLCFLAWVLASLLGFGCQCGCSNMSGICGSPAKPELPLLKVFKLSTTGLNLNVTTYSTLRGGCGGCCGDKPECPDGAELRASDTCQPADGHSVFEWCKLLFFNVWVSNLPPIFYTWNLQDLWCHW
jgi:hypothetical protein